MGQPAYTTEDCDEQEVRWDILTKLEHQWEWLAENRPGLVPANVLMKGVFSQLENGESKTRGGLTQKALFAHGRGVCMALPTFPTGVKEDDDDLLMMCSFLVEWLDNDAVVDPGPLYQKVDRYTGWFDRFLAQNYPT